MRNGWRSCYRFIRRKKRQENDGDARNAERRSDNGNEHGRHIPDPFQVASHYCGWEGIERRLGALMLEDIFDGGEEEPNAADR